MLLKNDMEVLKTAVKSSNVDILKKSPEAQNAIDKVLDFIGDNLPFLENCNEPEVLEAIATLEKLVAQFSNHK